MRQEFTIVAAVTPGHKARCLSCQVYNGFSLSLAQSRAPPGMDSRYLQPAVQINQYQPIRVSAAAPAREVLDTSYF